MRKFIYRDEKSSKFWNIEVAGNSFTVTFGKIDTKGQTQTKEFESEEACKKEAEKLLKEKLKKGYTEEKNISNETTKKTSVSFTDNKDMKEPYPFLFIGAKPLDWTEGSNCGYMYDIYFSKEPDLTEKNKLESEFRKKLNESKAADPDCKPWTWLGNKTTVFFGDRYNEWIDEEGDTVDLYDELWEDVAEVIKLLHTIVPIIEVINLNAKNYGDDPWTKWTIAKKGMVQDATNTPGKKNISNNGVTKESEILLKEEEKTVDLSKMVEWKEFLKLSKDDRSQITKIDLRFEDSGFENIFKILAEETKVKYVTLYGTRIKNIPEEISRLVSLEEIDLGGNALKSFPKILLSMSNLHSILLSDNMLSSLPPNLKDLQLKKLVLSSNKFEKIPNVIFELKELTYLDFSYNGNLAFLPAEIARLNELRSLEIGNTMITELPSEICSLKLLEKLVLRANHILNSLPEGIGLLQNLKYLDIGDTGLTRLPGGFSNLKNLEYLDLSALFLDTDCCIKVGNLPHLKRLTLQRCSIADAGFLFANHHELQELNFSGIRDIEIGNVIRAITALIEIKELHCKYLSLTELPVGLGNLSKLQILDLSNNSLKSIPEDIKKLESLEELNLSGNKGLSLEQVIDNIFMPGKLSLLNLTDTDISILPKTVGKLKMLTEIKLGGNPIEKNSDIKCIPEELGLLNNLKRIKFKTIDNAVASKIKSLLPEIKIELGNYY